ncbi:MAG TPA: PAS domain-containing protein [Stellaceae bacterium]|nr:PAS domain-containing protein [Stellaceae bacterium]
MDLSDPAADEQIADPLIRRFVRYWRERRGNACCPSRADLDPLDFRYVLGDVVLTEVQRAPPSSPHPWAFRYRLIGANIAERDGYDLTYKTLEDLPEPEFREQVRATWTAVCETCVPVYYNRDMTLDDRTRRYEVVVMPLSSNGRDLDMLISVRRQARGAA